MGIRKFCGLLDLIFKIRLACLSACLTATTSYNLWILYGSVVLHSSSLVALSHSFFIDKKLNPWDGNRSPYLWDFWIWNLSFEWRLNDPENDVTVIKKAVRFLISRRSHLFFVVLDIYYWEISYAPFYCMSSYVSYGHWVQLFICCNESLAKLWDLLCTLIDAIKLLFFQQFCITL